MPKIKILVSEPWDFESPDGRNICGEVIKESQKSIILKSNYPLNKDGVQGNIIKLSPRFSGDTFEKNKRGAFVNGGLFYGESINQIDNEGNYLFIIIGHIESYK